MPGTDDVLTAVYELLAGDPVVTALGAVFKGGKRPKNVSNPSITADLGRLEPGGGDGIWKCDVTVTVYADLLSNRAPDHGTHAGAGSAVRAALNGRTPAIAGGRAMPLAEAANGAIGWVQSHDGETFQEHVFSLVFVKFS